MAIIYRSCPIFYLKSVQILNLFFLLKCELKSTSKSNPFFPTSKTIIFFHFCGWPIILVYEFFFSYSPSVFSILVFYDMIKFFFNDQGLKFFNFLQ